MRGATSRARRALAAAAAVLMSVAGARVAGAPVPGGGAAPPPGRIVFARGFVPDRDFEIYTIDPDGSGETRLTSNRWGDQNPSWSPDGRLIAFNSNRSGNDDLYVMPHGGSPVRRLTDHPSGDADPDWAPDGSRLAFVSHRDDPTQVRSAVYAVDVGGGEPEP